MLCCHICAADDWRRSQDRGEHRPASLDDVGFIHLSTPEQVHLPANRLYAGRTDLVLLHIDSERLTAPIRWEPGVPTDPDVDGVPASVRPAARRGCDQRHALPAGSRRLVLRRWPRRRRRRPRSRPSARGRSARRPRPSIAAGPDVAEHLGVHGADLVPPGDVGDEHPGPHHVGQRRPGFGAARFLCAATLLVLGRRWSSPAAVVPATATKGPVRTARE